jgi:hypothetical protein
MVGEDFPFFVLCLLSLPSNFYGTCNASNFCWFLQKVWRTNICFLFVVLPYICASYSVMLAAKWLYLSTCELVSHFFWECLLSAVCFPIRKQADFSSISCRQLYWVKRITHADLSFFPSAQQSSRPSLLFICFHSFWVEFFELLALNKPYT